ncbi:glycerophosphodiester phosphodiesterase [Tichowtungia aerotolerans]|uniref:GP-PDE domain-containing protein n=1 Tax=Tichowtungia aerotolerans TaxID=2697043 RepID=A0A6P1M391_9BACT|nr:glycerophosphodiester phosphodiesterase family protein [Tichowtungia aerotolerans]QHI69309.1 hypothetical protein GT409_07545 [Tichowtungia aerotolerans]
MNIFRILFCSAILVITGCIMPKNTTGLHAVLGKERQDVANYRCTMGAHRGDSSFYTENSPRAIRAAQNNPRYAFIEFDVQYSADRVPVVVHDGNLRRVFQHPEKVKKEPFDMLQKLSGNEIAAYEDIMNLADGKRVNIEIKSQGDEEADRQLIDRVMDDIRDRGIEEGVLISSISNEAVEYVKTRYPEMKAGQIFFVKASTWLPFDFLTKGLYRTTSADYLMLYTANLSNIEDLINLKPKDKTLVFWDFGETMYIVHKDFSDRLWGQSATMNVVNWLRFQIARPFAR